MNPRKSLPAAGSRRFTVLQKVSFAVFASGAMVAAHSARAQVAYTDAGATNVFSTAITPTITGNTSAANGDSLTFTNTATSTQTDDLSFALNFNVLTFGNSGALTLNKGTGTSITLASTTGGTAPTVNLNNTGTVTNNLNTVLANNTTFAGTGSAAFYGAVSGAGSLIKTGAGTLTLGATNNYSGGTTISAGTLQLGDGTTGHDGSVTGNITNNASLVFNLFGNQSYGSIVSGTGSLTKTGAGTLTLSGNQTFSGGTFVNGGILQLNTGGGTGTLRGTVTVNAGGTLYLNATDALGYNNGQKVDTLNVNGGTVDNRTGGNQAFVTNFNLTGANIVSTGGGTYNFATNSGITTNASATTTVFSAGLTVRGDNGAPNGTYSVPISVAAGTTPSGVDLLVSGVIGQGNGTGGITKSGAGTMVLTRANTYQGATVISAGTFQLGNGGTTGSLSTSSAITDNGTFAINRSNAVLQGMDFSGAAITGTGGFSQLGTGTTTLNAANTFTGPTVVNAGTLSLTGSLTSPVTVNSGGTLTGFGNGTTTGKISNNLTVAGGGAVTLAQGSAATPFTVGGALTLGGTGPYGAGQYSMLNFTLGSGIEALNASGPLTLNSGGAYVSLTGAITPGTYNLLTYASQTGAGSFSLSSTMAGVTMASQGRNTYTLLDNATSLQLQVAGAAVPLVAYFNGAVSSKFNDLSNASVVNFSTDMAGTMDAMNIPGAVTDVILNATNAPPNRTASETLGANTTINSLNVNGNGTTTLAADGSTLTINALGDNNTASDGSYTGNPAGTGINIASNANAFTLNVPVALGNSQSWTNRSANLFTVGGTSVTGTATTGTQTLTLANTGAGGTTVNAVIGDGSLGGKLALAVNNTGTGATILTAANTYTGGTTISAGTLQLGDGTTGRDGSVTGNITDNGSLVLNFFGNQTFGNIISGTGAVTKNGASTLTVLVGNSYSGGTTLNAGTLVVGGTSALGTSAGAVTLNGGTLTSSNGGGTSDPRLANPITVNTGGNIVGGIGTALHLDGNISGGGPLGLSATFNGAGLQLTGNNSGYTGTVTVTGANVRLGSAAAGSAAASWVVNGNLQTDTTGTNTYNLGALSGTGNISGHNSNSVATLSVGALNTSTTFSGTIINQAGNNATSGNADGGSNNVLALTKVGTGTLTLTGANTYTGATTVNGGTLTAGAANALGGTGAITVNTSGTLLISSNASTDHVSDNAAVNLAGGTIKIATGVKEGSAKTVNPQETMGTSMVGLGALTLTLNTTSTLDFDSAGNATLLVFSSFNPNGGTLNIANYMNASYDNMGTSGSTDDDRLVFNQMLTPAQLAAINFGSGRMTTEMSIEDGFYEIGFTPVPEPSTWGAGLLGLGVLGFRLRRRLASTFTRPVAA